MKEPLPLIGIPTRSEAGVQGARRYYLYSTYTRAVELAGGAPILIPLYLEEDSLRTIFAHLDGLLLAGGNDVHPREYGEAVEPFCGEIEEARDAVELTLARWALDEKTPVFGICRGIQLLNIAAGGSLYQDISKQLENTLPHPHRKGEPYNLLAHAIEIEPQSKLARALGDTRVEVNSLHHQAVKQVAPGFRISARAPDGVIEGIESANGQFALGVQFHPEWLVGDEHGNVGDERMVRLFKEFVDASQKELAR